MDWVKLHASFHDDLKFTVFRRAGGERLAAQGFVAAAMSYCADQETGGFLPISFIEDHRAEAYVDRMCEPINDEESPILAPVEKKGDIVGYQLVAFAVRNEAMERIIRERESNRKRQAKWREKHNGDTVTKSVTETVTVTARNAGPQDQNGANNAEVTQNNAHKKENKTKTQSLVSLTSNEVNSSAEPTIEVEGKREPNYPDIATLREAMGIFNANKHAKQPKCAIVGDGARSAAGDLGKFLRACRDQGKQHNLPPLDVFQKAVRVFAANPHVNGTARGADRAYPIETMIRASHRLSYIDQALNGPNVDPNTSRPINVQRQQRLTKAKTLVDQAVKDNVLIGTLVERHPDLQEYIMEIWREHPASHVTVDWMAQAAKLSDKMAMPT